MPSKGAAATASELLKQIDGNISAVRKEVDEKSQYLQSLTTAREAISAGVLRNAVRSNNGNGRKTRRTGGNLTQSLLTILRNAPTPVSVSEIMAELENHQISGEAPTVRSTLTSLKKRNLVKNPEYGRWVAVTEETAKAA